MAHNVRRVGYTVLKGMTCESCGTGFDFNYIKDQNPNKADFRASYHCPSCNAEYLIKVEIGEDIVETNIRDVESGDVVLTSTIEKGVISQRGHTAKSPMRSFYNLSDIHEVLHQNHQRLQRWEDQIPRLFLRIYEKSLKELEEELSTGTAILDVQDSSEWKFLQAPIHNYLSTAYSFDQILETVREGDIEWTNMVEREFKRYNTENRVILGLRHYTQHEATLPLQFKRNDDDNERQADILTAVSEVSEMESQKSRYPPDGYKNGADYHYSGIDSENINISQRAIEHYISSAELCKVIFETNLESRSDDIEDYESFSEGISFDEIDIPDSPPDR